ncbi:MAG: Gldg family protein [Chromatiales bacterium]|nr:Gldg family protein [Chromatiales bacterium]
MISTRRLYGRLGLLVLAALFIVTVSLSNNLLRGLRIDLTENRLYTLAPGTVRLLQTLDEPVNVYLYLSNRGTADLPWLRSWTQRVQELLTEMAQRSDGRLRLSVIDPAPFSEEEDRAAEFGLRSFELPGARDPIWLGVAATNSIGEREAIPFLDPGKEAFLEYDIARMIYALATPERPVIGLLSGLPLTGGFDPMLQQPQEPWVIYSQLGQLFELRRLDRELDRLEGVDVLMLVHPRELSETTLYAIDQFILGGGRAMLFVDPWAEMDMSGGDPVDPMSGMLGADRASSLEPLLGAWGISIDSNTFVGDDRYALTVGGLGQRPVRHLAYLGITASGLSGDDVVTGGLERIHLGSAGSIELRPDSPALLEPLITTSDQSGTLPTFELAFGGDPEQLRASFQADRQVRVIAGRVGGQLPSAFPGGPPGADSVPPEHLVRAAAPVNLVLVADTDLLADRLWVQQQNFFGQRLATAIASNGDFVINALDNLSGSSDLIGIRSRATFSRPFTRVNELRREAEGRFRATEQRLQQELAETEARLAELQAAREDSGVLMLSPAQEAELARFSEQRLQIRAELREVQRGLDQSIEQLGQRLQLVNIMLMPLLVAGAGIALTMLRRRRRLRLGQTGS